ncbi:1,4-alpha-glucan-branching enzyme 3, chloroplastic/amyloplastic isoform X2 [Selaginella moellendorffii]|nr:1,4-alpha-glucan-branching enzyme 3, chloroplastic/amyloplastic isoform X2 [Selaginella moellendorffii]|eukprot:XP_002989420.2 1,4-alpha-glucan-branching enzyme 3, chloroplastic/amyloplastic isoform X2 [Selaginella moellendorffii]
MVVDGGSGGRRNKARYVDKNVGSSSSNRSSGAAKQQQQQQPAKSKAEQRFPRQQQQQQRQVPNPAGFVKKVDRSTDKLVRFLYQRFKALKDARNSLCDRDGFLEQHASGYDILGMRHHFFHYVEYFEWAPGATSCSLIGDFNNWDCTKNRAEKGYFGRDDYGTWRITVEDKLREGQEKDPHWQEYNYSVEYDRGDGDIDIEALYQKMEDEYWEPGEDQYLKDTRPFEEALFKSIFGENFGCIKVGKEEEVNELAYNTEDEETMDYSKFPPGYEEWVKKTDQAHLPPLKQDPTRYSEPTVVDDPVWRERVLAKKPPLPIWEYTVKGFKAWEKKYLPAIPHGSRVRVYFKTPEGPVERVPAWAKYVLPDPDGKMWSAVYWEPPIQERHQWQHERPKPPKSLRIYECHVGMSSEEAGISTFKRFSQEVLPHVKKCGYNVVQLMGVQEHVDYSSVGYKVTNQFAVSSRFGTPEDFKFLVDTAHGLGLLVFMDIVHSHVAPDEVCGLAMFDGANDCFLHVGKRGHHKRWGTRLFKYGEHEVKRFLLSNLKWWVEEYRIDGFYFHSVGSMLYTHNGFAKFTGSLDEYCNQYVNVDAHIYLILANELLHNLTPRIITIAEDATLFPGLCAPHEQGGFGFDYYVSTAPSDMWLYLIEKVPLEEWSVKQIAESLLKISNSDGKALVYVENHSQSISGGKSLFQALIEKNVEYPDAVNMLRSVSMIKMIKLLTASLGGSAYLTFMGNEFGHTERVEFPRVTNNFSYEFARRRWSLLDDKWHAKLAEFDNALMAIEQKYLFLSSNAPVTNLQVDDLSKTIVFTQDNLIFAYNFHPRKSADEYEILVDEPGRYELLLDTDDVKYGGMGRLKTKQKRINVFSMKLSLTLPQLSAQVYRLAKIWDAAVSVM